MATSWSTCVLICVNVAIISLSPSRLVLIVCWVAGSVASSAAVRNHFDALRFAAGPSASEAAVAQLLSRTATSLRALAVRRCLAYGTRASSLASAGRAWSYTSAAAPSQFPRPTGTTPVSRSRAATRSEARRPLPAGRRRDWTVRGPVARPKGEPCPVGGRGGRRGQLDERFDEGGRQRVAERVDHGLVQLPVVEYGDTVPYVVPEHGAAQHLAPQPGRVGPELGDLVESLPVAGQAGVLDLQVEGGAVRAYGGVVVVVQCLRAGAGTGAARSARAGAPDPVPVPVPVVPEPEQLVDEPAGADRRGCGRRRHGCRPAGRGASARDPRRRRVRGRG